MRSIWNPAIHKTGARALKTLLRMKYNEEVFYLRDTATNGIRFIAPHPTKCCRSSNISYVSTRPLQMKTLTSDEVIGVTLISS